MPGRELPGGRRAPARLRPVCSLGVSSSEPSSWSRPFTLKVLGCGIFLSSLFFLFSVFKISAETEIRHGLPRVFTRGGATHSQSFHPRQTPQGLTCCGVDGRVHTRRGDSGLHGAANVSHLWERLWCPGTRGHQQGRLPEGCLGLARGGPGSGAASGGSSGGKRRHSSHAGAPGARGTRTSGGFPWKLLPGPLQVCAAGAITCPFADMLLLWKLGLVLPKWVPAVGDLSASSAFICRTPKAHSLVKVSR